MKITNFKTHTNPQIEDIEKLFKDKLGDKYTYKIYKKSSSLASKAINNRKYDSIAVIKNAYHRTLISINKVEEHVKEPFTYIYFSEDTLAGWLAFLNKEAGFIGSLIIRLIYGNGGGFYDEVQDTIKSNIDGEDETLEAGLGALFKKKKVDA